ncbi:MFS transporter [Gordonia hydrophobica]|uniref:MFS transporter n=1 Tax=Gordonia hydrophobica TaxID=40516 RepID=A0ABZ2TW51_9ACTN|nr:MFS transporter [Gordonia hydrophobica]MBM7365864.1 MFS family permease [Gordonia hydrophobica]
MRRATTVGVLATTGLCLLTVGSNIPGPLLPLYRDRLDLSTFTVTALFTAYLVGLVATFTTIARTRLSSHAVVVLPIAITLAALGDLALLAGDGSVVWLFMGRILVGISVGLGTGATATIVLATRGERGRAIAATATLLGSFLGLAASAAAADLLPAPTITIYYLHIAALIVTATAFIALHRSSRVLVNRMIAGPGDVVDPSASSAATVGTESDRRSPRRVRLAGITLGTAGWAIGGVAVGLLPTVVTDMTKSPSITVTALAPIVLIGVACVAPRVIGRLPAPATAATIALGAAVCVVGVWRGDLSMILAACVVWGIGQGFAYATGLRIATAGMGPVQQGRAASQYASIAYALTGTVAVASGWIATSAGMTAGVGFGGAVFATLCAITVVLGHRRWPRTP